MDLYDMPLNYVHELYYYIFQIKDARNEEELKKEEEKKKAKEKQDRLKEINKKSTSRFDKPLSPAAAAKEAKHIKSQNDEKKNNKGEAVYGSNAEGSTPSIDLDELSDILEEGG